jgi:hypothetical protein
MTHEHEFEPELGLPEPLPQGERILWQGSPDWRMLARTAFHVRKLVLYFGVILALRAATVASAGGSGSEVAMAVVMLLPLVLVAIGSAALMAWLSSRTTVYTVTDKRVVMRVGIVLSLTFNLPLKRLATAGLRLHADGSGDIPLALSGSDTIAYLHLWPHARPWRVAKPEPMLRCVPEAAHVSAVLADAWAGATGLAVSTPAPLLQASRTQRPPAVNGDARAQATAASVVNRGAQGAGHPAHA